MFLDFRRCSRIFWDFHRLSLMLLDAHGVSTIFIDVRQQRDHVVVEYELGFPWTIQFLSKCPHPLVKVLFVTCSVSFSSPPHTWYTLYFRVMLKLLTLPTPSSVKHTKMLTKTKLFTGNIIRTTQRHVYVFVEHQRKSSKINENRRTSMKI